jgi:hypothetical protein
MDPASVLTELEARLASEGAATLRPELEAQLKAIERRLRERIILGGLSREDYLDYQAAIQAVQVGLEILTEHSSNVDVRLPNTQSPTPFSPQFRR